jgi:hypothetical protein
MCIFLVVNAEQDWDSIQKCYAFPACFPLVGKSANLMPSSKINDQDNANLFLVGQKQQANQVFIAVINLYSARK